MVVGVLMVQGIGVAEGRCLQSTSELEIQCRGRWGRQAVATGIGTTGVLQLIATMHRNASHGTPVADVGLKRPASHRAGSNCDGIKGRSQSLEGV